MADVITRIKQHKDATRLRTLDLDDWLATGSQATGSTWTSSPAGLVFGTATVAADGRSVTNDISGGVAGTLYCVHVVVTVDDGNTETFFFEILIVDDPC